MTSDDEGSQQEEFAREQALKFRKPETKRTGFCLDCGEVTQYSFCSLDCRWANERRTQNAKGK